MMKMFGIAVVGFFPPEDGFHIHTAVSLPVGAPSRKPDRFFFKHKSISILKQDEVSFIDSPDELFFS